MLKRLFDIAGATTGLVLLSPVLLVTAIAIRLTMGAPIRFRQRRPGFRGKPFEILKMRTMSELRDAAEKPLTDEQRLLPLGRFLRRTSLDELPELWNVLKGDMSLVGPRPLLMRYLDVFTPEQRRRHEVKPGITGLAQVSGRNALSWERKFELDVWYVDHQSFWLDGKILWLTLFSVIGRNGINSEGHCTMPEFTGTPNMAGEDRRAL